MPKRGFKFRYLLAGLLLVAVVAAVVFNLWTRNGMERLRAEHRAAGYPVTVEELAEYFAPTEEQAAAAREFELGFDLMVPSDADFDVLPIAGAGILPVPAEPFPEEMLTEIGVYLDTNEHAIRHLLAAAEMETAHFGWYYADVLSGGLGNQTLPRLAECRGAARALVLRSIYDAERGNSDTAVQSIQAILRLGAALSTEMEIMPHLVTIALRGLAIDAIETGVNRRSFSNAELARLQEAVREAENDIDFQRAFIGEFVINDLRYDQRDSTPPSTSQFPDDVWGLNALGPRFRAGVRWTSRAIGLTDYERMQALRAYHQAVVITGDPIEERWRPLDDLPAFDSKLAVALMPGLETFNLVGSRLSVVAARDFGQLRTARAAIAIERYRRANGQFPESLDELIPQFLQALPRDPYTNEPLEYRVESDGAVVYMAAPAELPRDGYDFETGERNHHQTPFVLLTRDQAGSGSDGGSASP